MLLSYEIPAGLEVTVLRTKKKRKENIRTLTIYNILLNYANTVLFPQQNCLLQ